MHNKKRTVLNYYTGLSSEGFDVARQLFSDKYNDKNDTLLKIRQSAREIIKENGIRDLDNKSFNDSIKRKLDVTNLSTPFFDFADTWLKQMIEKKGFDWSKKIGTAINKVREFDPNTTFELINKNYYNKFVEWMEGKGHAKNTIGSIIKDFRRVLNAATEAGVNKNMAFKSFKILEEDVISIYLSETEIERIYGLAITPELVKSVLVEAKVNDKVIKRKFTNMRKKINALERARKIFLIGCWTGLRVGNYKKIDPDIQIVGDFLFAIANKGGGKLKIPLHRMVRDILKDGWPAEMAEQKINDQIKDLGQLTGINENFIYYLTVGGKRKEFVSAKYELITTHTARRSFASNMLLRGIPKQYIMAVTGHKTEREFNKYTAAVQKDMLTSKLADYDVWK